MTPSDGRDTSRRTAHDDGVRDELQDTGRDRTGVRHDVRDDTRYEGSRYDGGHDSARHRDTTATDAEISARMAGTHQHDRVTQEHVVRPGGDDRLHGVKTSAAAVFGLVFGLAALFCALTAILSPAAVLFGLIGLVLGIVGLKMARRRGVTGRGVAIGGIVTSVLGLLIGGAVLVGASVLVNDEARLDQLQEWIDDRRDDLPSTGEIREELPS